MNRDSDGLLASQGHLPLTDRPPDSRAVSVLDTFIGEGIYLHLRHGGSKGRVEDLAENTDSIVPRVEQYIVDRLAVVAVWIADCQADGRLVGIG